MAEENNIEKKDTVYHHDAVIDIYPRVTFGRRPILTPYTEVTEDNVRRILSAAAATFAVNRAECEGLYQYYKGKQPILGRIKMERPEIKNIVIENRAYEIVTFKTGRFLYKDILYTNHTDDKDSAKITDVNELNRIMASDGKAGKDRELVDLFHICGHAYRMIVDSSDAGFPFHTYTIDPRRAFVVYSDTVDKKPLLGVYVTTTLDNDGNKKIRYTAYSKDTMYTIIDDQIVDKAPHILGDVPIVEYPANHARLGCFEVVMSLLNALNLAQSNRMDGVEQFIQALLVFKSLDMEDGDISKLKREGAICLPPGADMDYLTKELNQSQVQTLCDDLYQAVLTICGMPNRNGGSSTSDNKGAVVLRDGWSSAATAAKETKQYFEASEKRMLNMALKAFNTRKDTEVKNRTALLLSDVDIHFDEGEYENTLEKAQVLQMLLSNDYVDPRYAYIFSNITPDPEAAYLAGMAHHEKMEASEVERLKVEETQPEVVEVEDV